MPATEAVRQQTVTVMVPVAGDLTAGLGDRSEIAPPDPTLFAGASRCR